MNEAESVRTIPGAPMVVIEEETTAIATASPAVLDRMRHPPSSKELTARVATGAVERFTLTREMLLREDFEGLVEVGREQVAEGAHLVDVCVAYVGRDEVRDMTEALKKIVPAVPIPIMIDTTQLDVLEAALKLIGGRPIINSINLEDGEGKFDKIAALGVDFTDVFEVLESEGVSKFEDAWNELLTATAEQLTAAKG